MKTLILAMTLSFSLFAADVEVQYVPIAGSSHVPAGIPTMPNVPDRTWVACKSTNPLVTDFKLVVKVSDGRVLTSYLERDYDHEYSGLLFDVPLQDILSVTATGLHGGQSVSIAPHRATRAPARSPQ